MPHLIEPAGDRIPITVTPTSIERVIVLSSAVSPGGGRDDVRLQLQEG